jgi:hypothetical protein
MAVPKFIMKLAAKKAAKKLSGVLKTASKKEIKEKLRKRTDEAKAKVAAGSTNDFVKAEASYNKKDIRIEARNIKRAGLDGPKRTGPIKKSMSKEDFGMLSVNAKQDDNPGITQADFVVNAEKKGLTRTVSPLEKYKCGYNSKKKK